MQKIVLAVVGALTFTIVLVVLLLRTVGDAGKPFLEALSKRDFVAASALRTQRFKDAVSQSEFERFLGTSGLGLYSSGNWSSWRIVNGVGSTDGEITTSTGEKFPLRLILIKEDGEWRIDGLQPLRAGASMDSDAAVKPTPVEAADIVRATTSVFADAINGRNFTALRNAAAPELKAQFSVADLEKQFGAFIEQSIDLSPLVSVAPNFATEPSVDSDGVLSLIGYYAVEGAKVDFEYRYAWRFTGWRLLALRVNIGPAG